jgi:hypothetical protein
VLVSEHEHVYEYEHEYEYDYEHEYETTEGLPEWREKRPTANDPRHVGGS